LANSKLAFQPYSYDQLEKIIRSRLHEDIKVFKDITIGFAARKVLRMGQL